MALLVFVIAGTDIALAACAYKFDVGATVRARAIVEPWVISIAAAGFWFVSARDGLMLSYAAAMVGAFLTALVPLIPIGRASCRERVGQYVSISVVSVTLKKKSNV